MNITVEGLFKRSEELRLNGIKIVLPEVPEEEFPREVVVVNYVYPILKKDGTEYFAEVSNPEMPEGDQDMEISLGFDPEATFEVISA